MPDRRDNYEYARQQARPRFLRYDREEMIRRFSLEADENYLYVPFAGDRFRIGRATGEVEQLLPGGGLRRGDYEETMTLYDTLCCGNPQAGVGKNWCLVNELPGVGQNGGVGNNIVTDDAQRIDRDPQAFVRACLDLGGEQLPLGDLGFQLPLFPFLPVRLRFYHGDEEFPPQLSILFHDRTLFYMRYETTYYGAACLLRAIRRRMEAYRSDFTK